MWRMLAIFAAVFALLPGGATACLVSVSQKLKDIRFADTVVLGELIDFEKIGSVPDQPLRAYGLIRLNTLETWKGEERGNWEFYWWNSTFGTPEKWPYGTKFLIAGVMPGSEQPPLRGPSATVRGVIRPDLIQVLQAPCSSPFIFPADLSARDFSSIEYMQQRLDRLKSVEGSEKLQERLKKRIKDARAWPQQRLDQIRKLVE